MQRPAKSRSHHLALDRIDYGNRGRRTGWVAPAHVGRDSDGRDNIRDYFLTPSRLSMSESHRRDRNYDENADFNRVYIS